MPTVSVILTSYNHEKFLRESIESVLNQTFTDFELIVVDDCSTDDSWEIIESYKDARLVKIRHPKNVLFYANQVIANVTRGKYIAIHHSDDVWEPTKLAEQVDFLGTNPKSGAVFTWAQNIDEEGKPMAAEATFHSGIFEQPNRTRHEWLNFFFYKGNALCHPSILIRRKCYDDCGYYQYGLAQLPDFDMWMRLCMKYEIFVIPKKLVRYRLRNNAANASGIRPETFIRTVTEFYQVWKNYLAITSFSELAMIFPSAGKYYRTDGHNVKFIFAMICLEQGTFHWARVFGINLLYELMQDDEIRRQIQALYGFSHHDFLKITGENDLFLAETMNQKERQIAQLNRRIAKNEKNVPDLQ